MKHYIKSNNKGIILLEYILSLGLTSILFLGIMKIYKIQFNDLFEAKKRFHEIYSKIRINQISRKIVNDFDSHPFFILPAIHKGNISLSNGKTTLISSRSDDLKNDFESDAISYFKLNMKNLLRTKNFASNTFSLCPFFNKKASISDIRTFLAFSSEDFFEVSLNLSKNGNCYNAKINNIQSIVTSPIENFENISFLFFIPIESTYTIYLAKNKTLRFVTMKNDEILENQPILQNIYKINFSLENENENFIRLLTKLKIFNDKEKEEIFVNGNLLSKKDIFNFVSYINKKEYDY